MNKKQFSLIIAITCSALPIITLLILVFKYAVNIPFLDDWYMLNLFEKHYNGSLSLWDFWAQVTEHRPVVPTLIFFIFGLFTKYNLLYEIWFGVFLAFLTYFVFIWHINKNKESFNIESQYRWCWVFFAFFIFAFSPSSAFTWLTGWVIGIQQIALLSLCVGAFLLANYPLTISRLIGLSLCGIITTFSTPEGIVYWPVVMILLPFKKNDKFKTKNIFAITFWVIITVLVMWAYSINFRTYPTHPNPLFGWHHPSDFLKFILAHIGSPLVAVNGRNLQQAILWGILGLCLFFFMMIACFRENSYIKRQRLLFFLMIGLYSLLTAILRAVGRSGFGVSFAMACHYAIVGMLLWVSLFFIAYIQKAPMQGVAKVIFYIIKITLLSSIFIIICLNDLQDISTFFEIYANRTYARQSIMTGKNLELAVEIKGTDDLDLTLTAIACLKRFHLSLFSSGITKIKELPNGPWKISLPSKIDMKKILKVTDPANFSIDNINDRIFESKGYTSINKNSFIKNSNWFTVAGWAVDEKAQDAASDVIVTIDGDDYLSFYGIKRNEVMKSFGVRKYKNSGFYMRLLADMVGKGSHTIAIKIISNDKKYYYEAGPFTFELI